MWCKALFAFLVLLLTHVWTLCIASSTTVTSNITDLHSLLAFKAAIEIDPNNVLANNWTIDTNFCNWYGVSCSKRRQRVTALVLPNMGLVGTISPHVGNLSFLSVLKLRNNSLHGQVINELGRLSRLTLLALNVNSLTGKIPISLSICRKLQILVLHDNGLTGTLPKKLTTLPRLRELYLGRNKLRGTIPVSLGNLTTLQLLSLEQNELHGTILNKVGLLLRLTVLALGNNYFGGTIPPSLFNISTLEILGLENNSFTGDLPKDTGLQLPNLTVLDLNDNQISGSIPSHIFNISSLEILSLDYNSFTGVLPKDTGLQLPNLKELFLNRNQLSGSIPSHIFNISSLKMLSLDYNSFTGVLPKDTGLQLPNLIALTLGENQLTGSIPSYWYNASTLITLVIEYNNFNGTFPATLPLSLQKLYASNCCNLQDEISEGIGILRNLTYLDLSGNKLIGTIPPEIKGMERLQKLDLSDNELVGPIPEEICYLRTLGVLFLENNRISGSIPECIGNLKDLQQLTLAFNKLNSKIPQSLWSLNQLLYLNLSSNSLHGGLGRNFTTMKSLDTLDLSLNQLSGNIPDILGSFQSLTFLNLSWNSFSGTIPESFKNMISLEAMDISKNNISGHIPKSLELLRYLRYLNLSYNKLSGEIPTDGPFLNFTQQSFIGNRELCGESISKPCPRQNIRKSENKLFPLSYSVPTIAFVIVIVILYYVYRKCSRNSLQQNPETSLQEQRIISYHELSHATSGFSEANFLGSGGFGNVYKGILSDGEIVAVKLLNLTVDGAFKSFDAECKVLRTVRHRNLVKVISTCTNPELRALVLEYIPNGSLEKWLYSHNYCLSFLQRVNIMLDVAVAMDYLHCGQSEPVIHCDLKPSNVLLENDMVARVADFGIAKILAENKTETQTFTLGTFGYIAPEYGAEGRVSAKGDIFSYGIMLLETFTRKKPTDNMFSEELSFRQWVNSSAANEIVEVVDENLLNEIAHGRSVISSQRNLLALLELGLGCSRDSPEERFEMREIVTKLNKIK